MNDSAVLQLFLFRWRTFWREPYAVIWPLALQVVFGAPIFVARHAPDVPGVLVLSGAFGAMWGVGWPMMHMRIRGLLRRFAVTPMPRAAFFGVFVLHRTFIAALEAVLVTSVVQTAWPGAIRGSVLAGVGVAAAGAIAHGSLALLVTSRAKNLESALALMNLVLWPAAFGSGVLVAAPPSVAALAAWTPIGAHLALLRVALDGAAFDATPVLVLAAWSGAAFAVAPRVFRWT